MTRRVFDGGVLSKIERGEAVVLDEVVGDGMLSSTNSWPGLVCKSGYWLQNRDRYLYLPPQSPINIFALACQEQAPSMIFATAESRQASARAVIAAARADLSTPSFSWCFTAWTV